MEWKEVTLGELGTIVGGATPSTKNPSFYDGNIPWLTPKDLSVNSNMYILRGARNITEVGFKSCSCKMLPKGSVLFSSRAPIGYVAIAANDMCTNQGFKSVIPNEETDSEFLYYLLKYNKNYIASQGSGTTFAEVSGKTMKDIEVVVPKEKECQHRIASILSSLDRKIELNNKINADLEEMAQAIFKNWFVDFEPFKDGKFVDSELGMIPEGWKVVVFDNILKVTTTKTGKEGIPEYSVTNTGIHPRDEKFTKNLSKSSAKNKLIRKGNLVFGMSREILNWGIMKEEVGGVSSAYNVYIVDEKIVSTTYLECFIAQRMDYFADLIKPASREGQGVDKALLMKKIICIPPSEVLDVFLEKYNSIMHLTEIRNQENSRLSLLRDTLLPRLMSGELEVPE